MSKLAKKFHKTLHKSVDNVNPDSYDRMKMVQDEYRHPPYVLEFHEKFRYTLGLMEVSSVEGASEWLLDELTVCFRDKGMDENQAVRYVMDIVDCEADYHDGRTL